MTFLGSSDHFSLGSKWFWYLQNDKMYTLAPTESPSGVRNGPRRAKNGPQNPTSPILAYFGLFLGAVFDLMGPFLTPLGLSVGPNVYILSFWRYQDHLEPNGK